MRVSERAAFPVAMCILEQLAIALCAPYSDIFPTLNCGWGPRAGSVGVTPLLVMYKELRVERRRMRKIRPRLGPTTPLCAAAPWLHIVRAAQTFLYAFHFSYLFFSSHPSLAFTCRLNDHCVSSIRLRWPTRLRHEASSRISSRASVIYLCDTQVHRYALYIVRHLYVYRSD